MIGDNPNQPNNPFAPQQSWMSKQTNGSANPYGFGLERLAGKLALQRNRPGMATNTVPLPRQHNVSQGGAPQYQTNTPPSRFTMELAKLGLRRDPNDPMNGYSSNGQQISRDEYYRLYNGAMALNGQPNPQVQGNRTGTTAGNAYAAQATVNQPAAPGPRRPNVLGGY